MEFFPLISGRRGERCQLEERDLLQRVGKCSEEESSSIVDCTLSLGFSSSSSSDRTNVDMKATETVGWMEVGRARRCSTCGTTQTPLWRNGPNGAKSLCNACGIRFRKEERRASLMLGDNHLSHQKIVKAGRDKAV